MSKKKKQKLSFDDLVLKMKGFLNFPVMFYDDCWWGGLIDKPSRSLRYVMPLVGHGCWNGKKGSPDYNVALDIAQIDNKYQAYDSWNKVVVEFANNSELSRGKALIIHPAPKGKIAETHLGGYPQFGRETNLSYGEMIAVT